MVETSATAQRESLELASHMASQNLPAFGASLAAVSRIMANPEASGRQLAEVILRDPALTASVLRAANSVAMAGALRGGRIYTVSRAVVVLGMNALEAICVASLAVEHLQGNLAHKNRVHEVVGRAIHAGTQARSLGEKRGSEREDAERLFVEAVLSHVGEMAFWCFAGEKADTLDAMLRTGMDRTKAQQAVLGMSMQDFGKELLRCWGLDEAVVDSREVVLATELALASSGGWANSACKEPISKIAGHLNKTPKETERELQACAQQAADFAASLGLKGALQFIPARATLQAASAEQAAPVKTFVESDPALQVKVLAEMMRLLDGAGSFQTLFEVCLEGLHRAVGLDRVVLLLLNPARTELSSRMELSHDNPAGPGAMGVLYSTQVAEDLRGTTGQAFGERNPLPAWLSGQPVHRESLLGPVSVGGKVLGMVYADRKASGRALDAECLEAFRMFLRQLDLVGSALRRPAVSA